MAIRTFIFFITLFLLTSCSSDPYKNDEDLADGYSENRFIVGYLIEKNENSLTLELTGDSTSISDIIIVYFDEELIQEDFKEGQKLTVWYDMIRESYPPQTKAFKIQIEESKDD